jgi:NADH-quinone oxidoreductase subunit G
VLVVGSFLRKDHPLIAQRLRQAAKKGAQLSMLHSVTDDSLLQVTNSFVAAPSLLPLALAEIVVAAAIAAGKSIPSTLADIVPTAPAEAIAASLSTGERKAILLGNFAEQHEDASQLIALAQVLAELTGARLGCLTEAANSVGGYLAGALPQSGGLNAQAMLNDPRKAYIVLHAEPEFDCANPVAARAALQKAEFVVVLSPFRHGTQYADVLLPIGPFTETAGTFVSCEGRMQRFNGVVKPLGEARPAWKVLRVLGSLLGMPGFEFDSIDDARALLPANDAGVAAKLGNGTRVAIAKPATASGSHERAADIPIYFADPLVRRAPALQLTADAKPPRARMNVLTLQQLGVAEGAQVKVRQGRGEAVLTAVADAAVPAGVVCIAAAHPSTCALEGLSGSITIERA